MATETPTRRRFTVDDYHRMGETGILSEDDRVELIDGEIVEMTPIGGLHAACVNELTRILVTAVGRDAIVSVQNPVRLDELHEPQPDLAVLKHREDYRHGRLPRPVDVLLLVEVADTSLPYDRRVKLPLYARARIPEVWVVDLGGAVLERYAEPREEGFAATERARGSQRLGSSAWPGLSLSVDALIG